ncbi:hypothetical protein ABZ234_08350 [Nocardiopsis sp. NPDC006198]|uniref:hypothetical protein n=1 Tax=Nocardiopsis sp. NPDC006198 TaxID=3154472 RepID=UPI0033B176BB
MAMPTPDVTTPEGRFLTAYGSWQHARITAGFAMLTAPPPQALTLAANMAHWTVELDQAWEQLEGEAYTAARDAHAARGALSALRVVRERVGVLSAVELTTDGPRWRPTQDLALGPVDREVYAEHLAGRGLFDPEETVLDLLVNGDALAQGRGRQVLAQAAPTTWEAGAEAPHEPDPAVDKALEDSRDELAMFNTHTPEEIEAYHAQRGGYFLTLLVGEDENPNPGQVDGPLGAWYALMRQLSGRSFPTLSMGGKNPIYLFKGEYAKNTVHELAQVARTLNPDWEVVEGYRPAWEVDTESREP